MRTNPDKLEQMLYEYYQTERCEDVSAQAQAMAKRLNRVKAAGYRRLQIRRILPLAAMLAVLLTVSIAGTALTSRIFRPGQGFADAETTVVYTNEQPMMIGEAVVDATLFIGEEDGEGGLDGTLTVYVYKPESESDDVVPNWNYIDSLSLTLADGRTYTPDGDEHMNAYRIFTFSEVENFTSAFTLTAGSFRPAVSAAINTIPYDSVDHCMTSEKNGIRMSVYRLAPQSRIVAVEMDIIDDAPLTGLSYETVYGFCGDGGYANNPIVRMADGSEYELYDLSGYQRIAVQYSEEALERLWEYLDGLTSEERERVILDQYVWERNFTLASIGYVLGEEIPASEIESIRVDEIRVKISSVKSYSLNPNDWDESAFDSIRLPRLTPGETVAFDEPLMLTVGELTLAVTSVSCYEGQWGDELRLDYICDYGGIEGITLCDLWLVIEDFNRQGDFHDGYVTQHAGRYMEYTGPVDPDSQVCALFGLSYNMAYDAVLTTD
ncbi:MAG: hypothetical protein IJ493_11385 [Clostridia bacterium]|nr:hypothetical protein [Clostridia bacterium]